MKIELALERLNSKFVVSQVDEDIIKIHNKKKGKRIIPYSDFNMRVYLNKKGKDFVVSQYPKSLDEFHRSVVLIYSQCIADNLGSDITQIHFKGKEEVFRKVRYCDLNLKIQSHHSLSQPSLGL